MGLRQGTGNSSIRHHSRMIGQRPGSSATAACSEPQSPALASAAPTAAQAKPPASSPRKQPASRFGQCCDTWRVHSAPEHGTGISRPSSCPSKSASFKSKNASCEWKAGSSTTRQVKEHSLHKILLSVRYPSFCDVWLSTFVMIMRTWRGTSSCPKSLPTSRRQLKSAKL